MKGAADRGFDSSPCAREVRCAVAAAPMRVDLTGAYTDIAPVTDAHCSTTVSAAVAYFARVTATRRYDGKFAVYRDGKLVGHFSSKSSGAERDLVSVAAAALGPPGGVSVNVRLDLPPRSGLGTSAAVVVAVTRALVALSGKAVEKAPLAEAAAALERDAGIAGGKQDQYASVFGGVNAIEFAPTRLPRVVQLGEQASRLTETMLIAHCGGGRDSQDLVEAVMHAYRAGNRRVCGALARLAAIGSDMRVALSAGSADLVGELVTVVRRLQRELHDDIRDAIDGSPIMSLVKEEACWGKPVGGAGPGAAWLLVPNAMTAGDLAAALEERGVKSWPCRVAPGVALLP